MSDQSAENNRACIACAGEDDNPDFDYCRACGRVAPGVPPGAPLNLRAVGAAARAQTAESPLARAIRLARGEPTPEEIPHLIEAYNRGLTLRADLEAERAKSQALAEALERIKPLSSPNIRIERPRHNLDAVWEIAHAALATLNAERPGSSPLGRAGED